MINDADVIEDLYKLQKVLSGLKLLYRKKVGIVETFSLFNNVSLFLRLQKSGSTRKKTLKNELISAW